MRRLTTLALLFLPAAARADAPKVTFDDDVAPIVRQHCQGCHNTDKQRGGLNLATYAALKLGGSSGEVVAPGDPDKSRLYTMTAHQEEPVMPPSGTKIPDAQLELLRKWVELGAAENKGSKVQVAARPKVDLALKAVARGKPEKPAMPVNLPLEPVAHTRRAGAVAALAASPWAPVLAAGGYKQVVLFHPDTGAVLGVLPFAHGQVNSLKFSRNGQFLLAAGGRGGQSGRAILYEVESGKIAAEVGSAETDAILCADLSSDQSTIAVGTTSRLVRVYQVSDGALLHTIKKHTDWVTAIEYSPDGVLLASGDRNGGLFVWEAGTAREFYALRGPAASVNDLSWRADSNLLASASLDGTVRLWEMENGTEAKKWAAHGPGTESARFLPDGRLATTGRDKLTKLWDASGKQLRQFAATPDIGLCVAATFDNGKIAVGDWSGALQLFDAVDGKPLAKLDANPAPVAERLKLAEAELSQSQAKADQALATLAATTKSATEASAALAKLEADTKRVAGELAAQAKLVAGADAAIKVMVAAEPGLKAAAERADAALKAAGPAAEARHAAAGAYALAAQQLGESAAKSPGNAELQALAAEAQKLAAAHRQKATEADAAGVAAEAATKSAAAKLAAATRTLGRIAGGPGRGPKAGGRPRRAAEGARRRAPGRGRDAREAATKAQAAAKAASDAAGATLTAAKAHAERLRGVLTAKK